MWRKCVRAVSAAFLIIGTTTACNWTLPPWVLKYVPILAPKPVNKALINSYPIKVHDDCARHDREVDVVHVTITDVSPVDLETSTLSHFKSDIHGDVQQGSAVAPPPTPMPNALTHVDFVAAPYLRRRHDVALIELELTDKNYTFMPGTNATVITSKAAHGDMFCIKRNMVVPDGGRNVSFYVRWVDKEDGQPVIGAYNFVVLNNKHERRFMTVDPEVKNQG